MLNVTKELTALARKLGYTGKAPDTVAKAINAITASVGEGGGEGGEGCDCETMVLHEDAQTGALDKTYAEIVAAVEAGNLPYIIHDIDDGGSIAQGPFVLSQYWYSNKAGYNVEFGNGILYCTETENGYPTLLGFGDDVDYN